MREGAGGPFLPGGLAAPLPPRAHEFLPDQKLAGFGNAQGRIPPFFHSFGAIVAGANEYVVVESTFPRARKYQPLTSLVITNNSAENLDLAINGHDYGRLPAGVIWAQTDRPVWSFRITNNDSTNVASGEVVANITKPPMSQSDLARLQNLYT